MEKSKRNNWKASGKKPLISKDMPIGEVVSKWPETGSVMAEYGLHCIGCHISPFESIEAGAVAHGLAQKQIGEMLQRMNEVASRDDSAKGEGIIVSDSAAMKFRELMQKEGKEGWGLELSMEQEGCSGQGCVIDFAEKPGAGEIVLEAKGMRIFVSETDRQRANGIRIDYTEGTGGSGFRILMPKG
ncbi:Iron-binding protein IscA [uncultured archaeon]|nr:Iron-binding protein IscA [uncultured archaeon]